MSALLCCRYIDRFKRMLAYDMPKIIMIEEKHLDEVRCGPQPAGGR